MKKKAITILKLCFVRKCPTQRPEVSHNRVLIREQKPIRSDSFRTVGSMVGSEKML